MNPVDRPLLDIGLTRLEFLRISGKGLAGLTIAPALLSLLGCKQEDIDSGTVGLINTPKGVLVTQRARCTGCHRCEISCTNFNDGSVGTFFSRIKIHRNYFFGDNGVGSGGGLYGDLNYTADTCRQCKEPQCMNVCPIGAITWQQKEGCILMNPLMILVKIIKLRWIHILSYDQMVSRKINNQTTRCANSIF
ncbi:ferredoxin-like protein, partial [Escherichia coli]